MRVPRFSIRRLMVLVAVAAACLGAKLEYERLARRSKAYQEKARHFARRGRAFRLNLGLSRQEYEAKVRAVQKANEGAWFKIGSGPSPEKCAKGWPYYQALVAKYQHAARYPWLPVAPDPPVPR